MKLLAILTLCLALAGCGKEKDEPQVPNLDLVEAPTGKALFSDWTVHPSGLWIAEFEAQANFTGTPFNLVYRFSDGTETHCTAMMIGNATSGTVETTSCIDAGSGMSVGIGTAPFNSGGPGSYINDGITLQICKNNGSCTEYH